MLPTTIALLVWALSETDAGSVTQAAKNKLGDKSACLITENKAI